ncbi:MULTISPECIES: DUF317 domain-containing protein [Streptomyces]|uniref:DUF317 domain-containing protein n=1 Tax=Streptomyces TaxID=1883 RepID=UPI001CCDEB87|nr:MULTISPECIES: DUF317 domain-containing protein [Streptomyces]UBI40004.1 DUF317 domain-containing protein [Streptomyces mobaraensis]UKW32585.1 DUF317 domain-containing protein [Streptomyces sp. TYQ1024]
MTPVPEDIEQVLIAPRYLAGGGDPAWITAALHRACGWSHGNDPLMPRVLLTSPDQQAMLRLDPTPDQQWWTVQHARTAASPAWSASFGARTPVEIIAAVTDTLTHPALPTASLAADPYEPLRQAGWHEDEQRRALVSPDGVACVEHFVEGRSNSWFVDVADESRQERVWRAYFSGSAPLHLVAAFTRALAGETPLSRDPLHVPLLGRHHQRATTRQVPAAAVAFALEKRVKALASRGAPTQPPKSPPSVPPRPRSR